MYASFRRRLLLMALLCAMGMAVPLQAQTATVIDPVISQAQFAMDEAEYKKALNWIREGLKRRDLSTHSLLQLYWMEGTCYVSLGLDRKAISSYRKLLAIAPQYEADKLTPPKILRIFEKAQLEYTQSIQNHPQLQPRVTPLGSQKAQTNVPMRLVIDGTNNETIIYRVILYARPQGESAFINLDATATDENKQIFMATIPDYWLKPEADEYDMEYYWEILGKDNVLLANLGTSDKPFTFNVQPTTQPSTAPVAQPQKSAGLMPLYIALTVSAVVIAGIITAVYLAQPQTASAQITVSCEGGDCFP